MTSYPETLKTVLVKVRDRKSLRNKPTKETEAHHQARTKDVLR